MYITGVPFTPAGPGSGTGYVEGFTPAYTASPTEGAVLLSSFNSTQYALRPNASAAWDNYVLASSTFNGGGGSVYGYLTITYFV